MKKYASFLLLMIFTVPGCRKPICPEIPSEEICTKIPGWTAQSTGVVDDLVHLNFPSTSKGYLGGYSGRLLKTSDGGNSFETLNLGTTEDVNALTFVDENIGFVATNVSSLSSGVSHLYKTINGGQSFTSINVGAAMYYRSVYFLNAHTGFAGGGKFPHFAGVDGRLMKTTNGGANWTEVVVTGLKPINEIYFVNDQLGFTCGGNGQIFRTVDGGNSWTNISPTITTSSASNILFTDIVFLNSNTGYCVGFSTSYDDNFILKTTNGGNSWTRITTVPSGLATENFYGSIAFGDDRIGYVSGGNTGTNQGVILSTLDGGDTWTNEIISTNMLARVHRVNCRNIYISGYDGILLKANP